MGTTETNFKRLLSRCETRAVEKGGLKDDDKIRLQKVRNTFDSKKIENSNFSS